MRIDRVKFCMFLTIKDLTLAQLSKASGISRQTLSYIKQGKRCSVETGRKIAKALNVNINEIAETGGEI